MSSGYLEIRSVDRNFRYPLEKTQFSVSGDWDDACALQVRSLYYFAGEGPHEIATPPDERGPLFQFIRPITRDVIDSHGAIHGLQIPDASFEATRVPFPAGLSFGGCHLGVKQLNYSLTWLKDLEFQCRAEGSLQCIDRDPRRLDGANFSLDIQLPFDGVWLESADPRNKEPLNRFYDALFGKLEFSKHFDEFSDAVVLRAHR